MTGSVVSMGCLSTGWDRSVAVAPAVQRSVDRDPSLGDLLARKLNEHGHKLPRWLRRGSFTLTPCWFDRRLGKSVMIVTYCRDNGRVFTSVRTLAHHGKRAR